MKYRYVKKHNNYDLTLDKEYQGYKYKDGWVLIKDDKAKSVLYREECFEKIEQCTCSKYGKSLNSRIKCSNCGREL